MYLLLTWLKDNDNDGDDDGDDADENYNGADIKDPVVFLLCGINNNKYCCLKKICWMIIVVSEWVLALQFNYANLVGYFW